MSVTVFKNAQTSVEMYRKSTESYEETWGKDHEEAMKCMDFEAILAFGVFVFQLVNSLDEMWRMRVLKGRAEHDPKMDEIVDDLYRSWMNPCNRIIGFLESFERAGYKIVRADEFRAACREVKGLLMPDSDFFHHDELLAIRDQAITEHRDGRSIAELID